MTEIYADFVADHTFDHLRLRTTRILCREEHTKAVNPGAKAPKSPQNHAKNQDFSVWERAFFKTPAFFFILARSLCFFKIFERANRNKNNA